MTSQAFSQTAFSLLSLFPSTEQTIQLDCPSKEPPKVSVSHSNNDVAISMEKFLIIAGEVEGNMDVICEVEFDNEIIVIAWDASDECLAVVDIEGTVHLLKKDGNILLSRKISSEAVMGINFFTPEETTLQTLAVVYQGGKCFLLKQIDIEALMLCNFEDKIALGSILKSMKLEVLDLGIPVCRNIQITSSSNGSMRALALEDSTDLLFSFSLSKEDDENSDTYQIIEAVGKIYMFYVEKDLVYFVTMSGCLGIYEMSSASVVTSVFVSSSIKSILGLKCHSTAEESFQSLQCLMLDDDGSRYLCTVLSNGSTATTIIVPHGKEIMEHNNNFIYSMSQAHIWLQVNENGDTFLCRFSKLFDNISQQLVQQVLKALPSPSTGSVTGNFAVVLGNILALVLMNNDALSVQQYFETTKTHKFPAENILLSSFLLDYVSLQQSQTDINIYLSFVQKMLASCESDVGADESRKVFKKWRHYTNICNSFCQKFPNDAEHMSMDVLSPDQVSFHVTNFLAAGKVEQVLFLGSKLDTIVHSLHVASIPLLVHADQVVQFVAWQRSHSVTSDRDQAQIIELQTVESIYHRAESIVAERRGREAIVLLEYGLRMVQEQDCVVDTVTWIQLRTSLQKLLFATKIVVHCHDIFGVEYSLEEVQEAGIEGIVFERLDASTSTEVRLLAADSIPQITFALGIQKDELLLKWLQTTIDSSILNEDENEETFLIVEKLVYISECVEDAKLASQAALRLFQIPNLEKLLKRMGGSGAHIVQKASDLCGQLSDSVGEKLHEALRSFRLKVIASKYGIEVFDIRDKNHLMMLVSIICNNRIDDAWVDDLSYCAYDRGMIRLELHSVLIRILVSEDADASESVELLTLLFARLPDTLMKTVIDDAIKSLLNEFNEICDICYPEGFMTAKTAALLAQHQQTVPLESYIAKAKAFIDWFIDSIASKSISSTGVSGTGIGQATHPSGSSISQTPATTKVHAFNRASFCSPAMENLISRIKNLHAEYDIFLSSKKLQSSQACKKVLEAFIKSLTTVSTTSSSRKLKLPLISTSNSDELPTSTFVHLQKIATLMNLSPQFAINEVLKQYLALNKKKLALKLVYWNSEESLTRQIFASSTSDRDFVTSSVFTASTNSSTFSMTGGSDSTQDHEGWNMLVNQALSLNTAALKHNKTSSQYGYSAMDTEENDEGFEKNAFISSAKILSDAILDCDENSLCTALDCLSATSTTLRVYERFEQSVEQESTAAAAAATSTANGNNSISDCLPPIFRAPIPSDGLLMQQEASIPLLSAYCMHELQRRAETTYSSIVFGKKAPVVKSATATSTTGTAAQDIERLVEYFQKTENHMLALQVLSQTWALDLTKVQLLKSSLVALCRKLLTYRDINYDYAIACLSCLPMETMFQELKMAVPTIQNDFSRLHSVALIGEELSFLWDQERQLELFQSLQSHAKWWHLLSSIGLKIDMKAFQHADIHTREVYVQSLIPSILQKSGLNLELTLDYCRSFDVHPEYASLQYVELMLSLPPSVDIAQENVWIARIAAAASGLDERQLTTTLYRCLPKIHPLDYERIIYVCHWIVNLAPGQVEDHDDDDDDDDDEDDDKDQHHEGTGSKNKRKNADINEQDHDIHQQENNSNNMPNISSLNSSQIQLTGAQRAMASKKPIKLTRHDVDTCQKYIDTIQYLSSLIFGNESIDLIKNKSLHQGTYQGMKGHFGMRIPFWTLTLDPWSVLTPVLTTASPNLMEKLLPLCYLLGIDKEEFTARSLHSMFQVKKRSLKDVHDEEARMELKRSFATLVEERAMLFTTKLKVWRLVFKSEKEQDKDFAIYALQHGLQVVEKVDEVRLPDIHSIRRALTLELTKLQVEDRIHHILSCSGFVACHQAIFALIDRPNVLLMKVLETIVEHAWTLQARTVHHASVHGANPDQLPRISLTQSPTLLVLEFLQSMRTAFAELAMLLHVNNNNNAGNSAASTGAGATDTLAPTLFDTMSHEFVSRLLTENASGKDVQSAASPSGASTTASSASGGSASGAATAGQDKTGASTSTADHFWRSEKLNPAYIPSDAEWRRREDAFFGFALIGILILQTQPERRNNFLQQLDVIMRGVNRTLRRITTRSRYRAALAVHYFQTSPHHMPEDAAPTGTVAAIDTLEYVKYLYCLSEMHELRLTSTEMSLQSALGLKVVDVSVAGASGTAGVASNRLVSVGADNGTGLHTRSLIITWLHDEGLQVSVVELARDLFYLAPKQDPQVLSKLFRHMLDQDFRRSVYTSLIWWEQFATPTLTSSLLYGDVAEGLVPMLWHMMEDSAAKAGSMNQTWLAQLRSSVSSTSSLFLAVGSHTQRYVAIPHIFEQQLSMHHLKAAVSGSATTTEAAVHQASSKANPGAEKDSDASLSETAASTSTGTATGNAATADANSHKSRFNRYQVTTHPRLFYLCNSQSHSNLSAPSSNNMDAHLEELLLSSRHQAKWLHYFLQSTYGWDNTTEPPSSSSSESTRKDALLLSLSEVTWDLALKLADILHTSSDSTHFNSYVEHLFGHLGRKASISSKEKSQLAITADNEIQLEKDDVAAAGVWQMLVPFWQTLSSIAVSGQQQQMHKTTRQSKPHVWLMECMRTHAAKANAGKDSVDELTMKVVLLAILKSCDNDHASFIQCLDQISHDCVQETNAEVAALWIRVLLRQVTGWETLVGHPHHQHGVSSSNSSSSVGSSKHEAMGDMPRGLTSAQSFITEAEHQRLVSAIVQHCVALGKLQAEQSPYAAILKASMDQCSPAERKVLLSHWKQQQLQNR